MAAVYWVDAKCSRDSRWPSTAASSGLRIGEAAIQTGPEAVELGSEGVESLDQIVKHLADDWIHGAAGTLEASEVGVGGWEGVLQQARWAEIDGFDTNVSGGDR